MHIYKFPFDTQRCNLSFASTAHSGEQHASLQFKSKLSFSCVKGLPGVLQPNIYGCWPLTTPRRPPRSPGRWWGPSTSGSLCIWPWPATTPLDRRAKTSSFTLWATKDTSRNLQALQPPTFSGAKTVEQIYKMFGIVWCELNNHCWMSGGWGNEENATMNMWIFTDSDAASGGNQGRELKSEMVEDKLNLQCSCWPSCLWYSPLSHVNINASRFNTYASHIRLFPRQNLAKKKERKELETSARVHVECLLTDTEQDGDGCSRFKVCPRFYLCWPQFPSSYCSGQLLLTENSNHFSQSDLCLTSAWPPSADQHEETPSALHCQLSAACPLLPVPRHGLLPHLWQWRRKAQLQGHSAPGRHRAAADPQRDSTCFFEQDPPDRWREVFRPRAQTGILCLGV